jgi:peptidoglycan/LPS O-acetylase OafA/YrhL
MSQMPPQSSPRNTGLDVIRGLAIALVVVHHLRMLPGCPPKLSWFALRAGIGVDLFFVLSGWLIGGQLLRGVARTGTVGLWRFWGRRWLRTLPAYYLALLVMVVLGRLPWVEVPRFAAFAQNYSLELIRYFPTWSLCIEEHFYVALPLVLLVLLPVARWSRPAVTLIIIATVLVSPLLRAVAYAGMRQGTYESFLIRFYAPTHLRLDGLALGVAFAAVRQFEPRLWALLERHARGLAVVGVLLVVASNWNPWLTGWTGAFAYRVVWWTSVPNFTLVSLGTALTLPLAIRAGAGSSRLRDAITWFAELAYTLYLTNELARDLARAWFSGGFVTNRKPGFWVEATLAVIFALGFAISLRELAEKPGLRLRDRWLARRRPPPPAVPADLDQRETG